MNHYALSPFVSTRRKLLLTTLLLLCFPIVVLAATDEEEESQRSTVTVSARLSPFLLLTQQRQRQQAAVNLVPVECPSELREFTAVTDLIFVGRNYELTLPERAALNREFRQVYNGLTTQNCDGYFRRMVSLEWQNQTLLATEGEGARYLQTDNTTSSKEEGDIAVTYKVAGTCRSCPLTQSGSFDLYDEASRRRGRQLLTSNVRIKTRELRVRKLQTSTTDDCVCAEGTSPDNFQAPGVQECADDMNDRFATLQSFGGLFQDLTITDLQQLDDLSEIEDELLAVGQVADDTDASDNATESNGTNNFSTP